MSLELSKINQSIFIPVSFVEHLNKHSKMSKKNIATWFVKVSHKSQLKVDPTSSFMLSSWSEKSGALEDLFALR